MTAHILLITLALACSLACSAQVPPLETDRPDQTESPAIVPGGWLQMEIGWVREMAQRERRLQETMPTALTKFGLCRWAELRLITEVERSRVFDTDQGVPPRLAPIAFGTKLRICGEHGLRPRTSVIAHVILPKQATSRRRREELGADMRFTMQHGLSDRLNAGYNLGAEWNGGSTIVGIYTLTLGLVLNERWGAYVETYGEVSDRANADHRFDGGATFLIAPSVQLDVSAGRAMQDPTWFVGAGLSLRTKLAAPRTITDASLR